MDIGDLHEILYGTYFSFLLLVLPITNGVYFSLRFNRKWLKVLSGVILTGLTMCLYFSIFYILAFLVYPYSLLISNESSPLRDLIYLVLTISICSAITWFFYISGKKKRIREGLRDLIHKVTGQNIFFFLRYLSCMALFSLGFSFLLQIQTQITENFIFVDAQYFINFSLLFVITALLFVAGLFLFSMTRKAHHTALRTDIK